MRKALFALFAVALALAAPAAAGSQPLPQDLFVEAALYSNVVTVHGEDLDQFEIVLALKNPAGAVLAEMDVFPPYGLDGDQATLFLTDFTDAAAYTGLLPGEWLELEFRYHGEPGPKVSHLLSDITVTSVNVGADTIRGTILPRKSPTAYVSFSGMKFVPGGLPPYYSNEVPVRADGTFSVNAAGAADLVRNGQLFVGYQYDVFGVYVNGFVPGLVVLEDTQWAIATGTPLMSYKGKIVKPNGEIRGTSAAQPLQWLGIGLFQFHKGRAGAPIRRGDTVKVAGDFPYSVQVPKNFRVQIVENADFSAGVVPDPPIASSSVVLTAPADNLVCLAFTDGFTVDYLNFNFSCGTLDQLVTIFPNAAIDPDGKLVIALVDTSYPGPYPGSAAIAFTGGATGDVFVSHAGLQNPLSFLLTNLEEIMYGTPPPPPPPVAPTLP
jgi:hypothetical protein